MPNVVLHFQDIAIINAEQQIAQMSMRVRKCVGVCALVRHKMVKPEWKPWVWGPSSAPFITVFMWDVNQLYKWIGINKWVCSNSYNSNNNNNDNYNSWSACLNNASGELWKNLYGCHCQARWKVCNNKLHCFNITRKRERKWEWDRERRDKGRRHTQPIFNSILNAVFCCCCWIFYVN